MLAVGGHVMEDLDPTFVRMTTGLAGGVGSTYQEMCGALSAGVMVIGGLHGRVCETESDEAAYRWSVLYRERFAATLGTTQCQALRDRVQAVPGNKEPCALVVEQAAAILLEVLEEARHEGSV